MRSSNTTWTWHSCRFPLFGLLLIWIVFIFIVIFSECLVIFISDEDVDDFRIAKLFFLSSTVNYSLLHQSSYHVINLTFPIPGKTESYIMHLSKPDDLFNPETLGFGSNEIEEYSCVYNANILTKSGIVAGIGSLSSCEHLTGFEGLISLDDTHYHIAPCKNVEEKSTENHHVIQRSLEFLEITDNDHESHQTLLPVAHKVTPVKTSSQSLQAGDTKHVDPKELAKAYDEMLKDQESLEDEGDEDEETATSSNFNNVTQNYTRIAIGVNNVNAKRPKTKKKVVELAVFTDEPFYKKWKAKSANAAETDKKINKFVLALVNNMNYLYAQPSMKEKISFRLVDVEVQKTKPKSLKSTAIGEKYLDNFCEYAGKKDKNGKLWDHAMMVTGHDLKDTGKYELLGIAFTSAMCLRYLSCSVVKFQKGFETAFTATHEIGHSLGMEHDGETINKKCDPSKFIMAAIAGKGQRNWSPCSNRNLKNYLASGDPAPKVKAPNYLPRCLTKKSPKSYKIKYQTGNMPGQVYTAKEQCEVACKGCTPHVTQASPYNNICWMLHCKDSANKKITAISPALEGTSCGADNKKSCRHGKCQ